MKFYELNTLSFNNTNRATTFKANTLLFSNEYDIICKEKQNLVKRTKIFITETEECVLADIKEFETAITINDKISSKATILEYKGSTYYIFITELELEKKNQDTNFKTGDLVTFHQEILYNNSTNNKIKGAITAQIVDVQGTTARAIISSVDTSKTGLATIGDMIEVPIAWLKKVYI
jgi:hypothetical protein